MSESESNEVKTEKRCFCLEVEIPDEDEVEDCCENPCCLCKPCKDHPLLENAICMRFRTSQSNLLLLAVVVGFILGNLLTLARPDEPGARYCYFQGLNNNYMKAETQSSCFRFGSIYRQGVSFSDNQIQILEKKQRICLNDNCSLEYTLFNRGLNEMIMCHGKIGNTDVVYFDDNSACDKLMQLGPTLVNVSAFYVQYDDSKAKSCSCVHISPQERISRLYHSDNDCDSNDFQFDYFLESTKTSTQVWDDYNHELYVYEYTIDYMFKFFGKLWIDALVLIILPLLIANLIVTISDMTDMLNAAKLGGYTFLYYFATTVFAAIESLIINSMILLPTLDAFAPFKGDDVSVNRKFTDTGSQIANVFEGIVCKNIIGAAVGNNYLGIMFFCIIVGMALPRRRKNGEPSVFYQFFVELNKISAKLLTIVINFTPLGIFLYITATFATHDATDVLKKTTIFLSTVFTGLAFHLFVIYPSLYYFFTRKNPFVYMYNILDAMLTALAISSSFATLPVTLRCAKKNKVQDDIARFCLYIGATINMDGTTIGFPTAAMFVAYGEGITLNFGDMLLIVILSTVSSMGAAPIPQSGLVLLMIILGNLAIPMESVFSLIVAVDWIYDRPETMVNVVGDSFAAGIMSHFFGNQFDEDRKKLVVGEEIKQEEDVDK